MNRLRRAAPLLALAVLPLAGCGPLSTTSAAPVTANATTGLATPAPDPVTSPAATSTVAPDPAPVDQPTPTPIATTQPQPTSGPTTEPAVQPTSVPTPDPAQPAAAAPQPLKRGDSGPAVAAVQQRLAALGYFVPAVSGTFTYGTQQAVWALQKAAGLPRDGAVGPATQAALDAGIVPKARTHSGHVIEVNLERQLVLAVDDGRVLKVMNASTGSGKTYEALGTTHVATTPRGSFRIGRQVDGPYESTLGLGEMYRPKFFTGGYAVHGSPSIPPYPASHGCVRVLNAAMDWIWGTWTAPPGTAVVLY